MEFKAVCDIFIEILRSELTGIELDASIKKAITPKVALELYKISKKQDLAHVVSSSLYKNGLLEEGGLLEKFNQTEIISVYRNNQQKYAYSLICKTLDEANIEYIPLKGSVIRPFYPKETMRTSCDIDILIKEENLDNAIRVLEDIGFVYKYRQPHDVTLFFSNIVNLELHFSILQEVYLLDNVLKDAWSYAVLIEGSCYKFEESFFVFHMFAHAAFHFMIGGCGLRILMDVWVMKHNMGITYLDSEELLKKAEIYEFAKIITKLSEECFEGKERDDLSEKVLKYILNGGIYGNSQNKIALDKGKSKGIHFFLKRVFKPYNGMVPFYPILKKLPILLPFCWIIRIFKMIFKGKLKNHIDEMKISKKMSNEEIEITGTIKKDLGLKF